MGNASIRFAQPSQDPRINMQSDLPKFVMQTKSGKDGLLGDGKLMKTYCMYVEAHSHSYSAQDVVNVVVKVYMKLPDEDLAQVARRLAEIWQTLSPTRYPNLLPYQLWIRSASRQKSGPTPVYLIRQHFAANLYDRMLTRPFINDLEKRWLIFQLFKCLELAHSHNVVHGDVKPENIMCTTWNFLILTDFASYKPTLLPDDDPTDFQYYFDTMGRRKCYIAPERFVRRDIKGRTASTAYSPDDVSVGYGASDAGSRDRDRIAGISGQGDDRGSTARQAVGNAGAIRVPLNEAMDVFSLGCSIAEVRNIRTALDFTPTYTSLSYMTMSLRGLDFFL